MTASKPEVKRYDDMGCPEQICRVDTMHESDDGDFVLYEDYKALQAAHEEELFRVRQDRDTHFGEMMRAIGQVDALQAECEELRHALFESRANDRQAMAYLNQVRDLVGGDDFPDMVRRCEKLRKDAKRYRWLRADNAYFPEENYIRGGQELDAAIDAATKADNPC